MDQPNRPQPWAWLRFAGAADAADLAGIALEAGSVQGQGLASDQIGVRGLLVHAASPEARDLDLHLGFDPSPLDPMVLMLRLGDLKAVPG